MRCFGRCKLTNVIYSLVFWLFLVTILFITLNNVEGQTEPVTTRSEVLAHPLIPGHISQSAESRVEVAASTEAELSGNKAADSPGSSCLPLHFIPHAETRPMTALVSFPGSGNTWLRYLIQESTGIHTGSQYIDNTLMSRGFPGEPVFNASVAVVKTHEWGPKIRNRFQKAVLLIRHPKPAIHALFNLYNSQGHTGCAEKSNYERDHGYYWQRFFRGNIRSWQYTVSDWIRNFKGPLHIVLYDQLRNDLGQTLRSLVQFLDVPVDEAALQCTVEHSEGLYHRQPCPDSFDPFTESMNKQLVEVENKVFKELDKFLKKN